MVDRRAEAGARFVYVLLDVLFEFNIPALVATYMMIYTFIDARPLCTMANIYRLFFGREMLCCIDIKISKMEKPWIPWIPQEKDRRRLEFIISFCTVLYCVLLIYNNRAEIN